MQTHQKAFTNAQQDVLCRRWVFAKFTDSFGITEKEERVPVVCIGAKKLVVWGLKKVSWSDKFHFLLYHANGRIQNGPKEHTLMHPPWQMTTLQAGGSRIMLLEMFSWSSWGPVISVNTTFNTRANRNIVADHMCSFMSQLFSYVEAHFEQGNAHCHRARSIPDWLKTYQSLTCFHSHYALILLYIFGTKSKGHFET